MHFQNEKKKQMIGEKKKPQTIHGYSEKTFSITTGFKAQESKSTERWKDLESDLIAPFFLACGIFAPAHCLWNERENAQVD